MNIAVFASGKGSNFKNLIHTLKETYLSTPLPKIKVLIADRECEAINIAKKNKIAFHIIKRDNTSDIEFTNLLYSILEQHAVHLILLAGYMRVLPALFIDKYPLRIMNIHPSLLPKYKGTDAIKRAWQNNDKFSGVTIHYVNNTLDGGKILLQDKIPIDKSFEDFKRNVHELEYLLYSRALKYFVSTKKALVVSKCLLGVNSRYDASNKKVSRVLKFIEQYDADIYFVCPETEIGMDTPRASMESRFDLPALAKDNVKRLMQKLEKYDFIEFILKENSPSCGVNKQDGEIYIQVKNAFKQTNKKIIFITENDL